MSVLTTAAVLLRSHNYSETSRILRFYTESRGNVSVMARGVRRSGAKGKGGLDTWVSGDLTLYVKDTRELQTYKDFSPSRTRFELAADVVRFGGAAVMGELVLRHGGEGAHPELFAALEESLDSLQTAPREDRVATILARTWALVTVLGYEPVLDVCTSCGRELGPDEMGRFDLAAGGLRCESCAAGSVGPRVGPGARDQLRDLLSGEAGPVTRPRAHLQLLSDFITYHVSGARPMESFSFLGGLLPSDEEVS